VPVWQPPDTFERSYRRALGQPERAMPGGMNRLYICQTCVRAAALHPGEPSRGRLLADAVEPLLGAHGLGEDFAVRRVSCLGGCLSPCNVALRGQRKYSLRFSRLEPANAPSVVALTLAYVASPDGDLAEDALPADLRDRRTVRTPPPHLLLGGKPSG